MSKTFDFGRKRPHSRGSVQHAKKVRDQSESDEPQDQEYQLNTILNLGHEDNERNMDNASIDKAKGKMKSRSKRPSKKSMKLKMKNLRAHVGKNKSNSSQSDLPLAPVTSNQFTNSSERIPEPEVERRISTLPYSPAVPGPPSMVVWHQKEETQNEILEVEQQISNLPDADFKSLVDFIKNQKCCSCHRANLLFLLHGNSNDTGIAPALLDRISKAVS